MEENYKLHRVNTKISDELNSWLDEESRKTGISKSSLIMLAVQSYHDQKTVMKRMGDMGEVVRKLDDVIKAVERKELE